MNVFNFLEINKSSSRFSFNKKSFEKFYKITLYENYFTIKLYFHKNEILYYYSDILNFNSKTTKSTNLIGNASIDQTSKLLTNDGKIFLISPSQFENYIEIRNKLFQKSNKNK
jgi:hypothetical protein